MSTAADEMSPSRRPALAETAYERIRRDVLFGDLAAAPRLAEQELAQRYRMSRTPVREALQRLAVAGFLESNATGGYIPHKVSARDVREIYELRMLLEPLAAQLAVDHVSPEQATRLDFLSRAGWSAVQSKNELELPQLNAEFHSILATASGNATLARVISAITDRLAAHHIFATGDEERQSHLVTGHGEIVAALRAADRNAAAAAVASHLEYARDILVMNL